jgi:predicted  nucleic acid-binding Zn-ribbon protein
MNSLEQLYRLQDRILFVRDRVRERDTVPADLVEVDREYREKVEAVTKLKARLTEAEKEARKADSDLADLKEKQKKFQTQLRSVQSSREYSAALNEIDAVERVIRTTEDRLLGLEEEIESARGELSTREESLPAETVQHEERLKDWRAAQRAINEELAAAETEIQRLEAEIPPRDRSEFHRLLDKKRGLAISRVIQIASSYSCSACHVKIRPAALQVLKAGREIVYCDSCKRILYYDSHAS